MPRGDPATELAWERWPEWLHRRADEATDAIRAGQPSAAVAVLDDLIADLDARRQSVADIANRHFEPSTDDRTL